MDLLQLPQEVVWHVLAQLPTYPLIRSAQLVCKAWNQDLCTPHFWFCCFSIRFGCPKPLEKMLQDWRKEYDFH